MLRRSLRLFTLICLSIALISCSKINQKHFDQVKPGMTMSEVTSILGTPTSTDKIDLTGLTGTSAVWKDDKVEIDIQFINDKVSVKSFSKLE